MERRCHFVVTVSIESERGTKVFRFTGEKSLPFVPWEGRRLHLGGRNVYFEVDRSVYDMGRDIFLVDGGCLGPAERSQALADGLRSLGWQEDLVEEKARSFEGFNSG